MARRFPFLRAVKPGRVWCWNGWVSSYWRLGISSTKSWTPKTWSVKLGPFRMTVVKHAR